MNALRSWAWLIALALLALPSWAQTEAGRRVALVIGNNAYANGPLLNPVNDARAMAAALQGAGFTVILKTDATQPELLSALRDFGNRLKEGGTGTAGLFYFAGHGMQVKGRNFLVPIGANIEHEDELPYQALDAQAVMDKMESAGNGTNIVILDACRNNPFVRSFRSGRQGLAQMDAPVGTLVAFSTAPGSVASDGNGRNGLYTSHLLNAIKQPGQKVEDVFKQVRFAVLRDSARRQVPWEASSLVGDFYFVEAPAGAPQAAAALPPAAGSVLDPQSAIDEALWSAVRDSSSSAELFAYLNRFPTGRYAREARARLADLVAPATRPGQASPGRPAPDTGGRPLSLAEVDNVLRQTEEGERSRVAQIALAQQRIDEIVTWATSAPTAARPTPGAMPTPSPKATATATACSTRCATAIRSTTCGASTASKPMAGCGSTTARSASMPWDSRAAATTNSPVNGSTGSPPCRWQRWPRRSRSRTRSNTAWPAPCSGAPPKAASRAPRSRASCTGHARRPSRPWLA